MMTAERKSDEPIPVRIVEEKRAPQIIVGKPRTYTPLLISALTTAGQLPEVVLPYSERRARAVVSVVGNGVVILGDNPGDMMSGAATRAGGAYFQGPCQFELESTNQWYVALAAVGSGTTTVSIIAETQGDV